MLETINITIYIHFLKVRRLRSRTQEAAKEWEWIPLLKYNLTRSLKEEIQVFFIMMSQILLSIKDLLKKGSQILIELNNLCFRGDMKVNHLSLYMQLTWSHSMKDSSPLVRHGDQGIIWNSPEEINMKEVILGVSQKEINFFFSRTEKMS